MSVTLRLEGLSNRESTDDVRKFFVGLDIPKRGIHIIGGLHSEAFVEVATWDDAYRALQMSGQQIKDSTIRISVITSEEKQQALENHNKLKESALGRNGAHEKIRPKSINVHCKKYFLRLDIADFSPTEEDVRNFFDGASIKDILFCKDKKSSGELVFIMLDNKDDANKGYQRYKESKILHIRWADSKEWVKYGGKLDIKEDDCISSTSGSSRRRTRSRSPRRESKSPRKHSRIPQKNYRSSERRSRSPHRHNRSPVSNFRSPQSQSEERDSTNPEEYHVRLMNLSSRASREDVQSFFHNHVRDDRIVFVCDESGQRTRECFATFTRKEHLKKALTLDQQIFKGHKLSVSLISKKDMQGILSKTGRCKSDVPRYIHLRSFPPGVTKSDVKVFFKDFSLNEEDIFLLFDKNDTCSGDVLVKFSSSKEALRAAKLDRTLFKDKRIPLRVIHSDRLTSFLDASGLHMFSIDPNECVTQEDDPSEDELPQENDACNDEPVKEGVHKPEDEHKVKKERSPECVSKADD